MCNDSTPITFPCVHFVWFCFKDQFPLQSIWNLFLQGLGSQRWDVENWGEMEEDHWNPFPPRLANVSETSLGTAHRLTIFCVNWNEKHVSGFWMICLWVHRMCSVPQVQPPLYLRGPVLLQWHLQESNLTYFLGLIALQRVPSRAMHFWKYVLIKITRMHL